jgi:hypothetical protein
LTCDKPMRMAQGASGSLSNISTLNRLALRWMSAGSTGMPSNLASSRTVLGGKNPAGWLERKAAR